MPFVTRRACPITAKVESSFPELPFLFKFNIELNSLFISFAFNSSAIGTGPLKTSIDFLVSFLNAKPDESFPLDSDNNASFLRVFLNRPGLNLEPFFAIIPKMPHIVSFLS